MGLFGGGGSGNNKTEVKPWKPQREHLKNIFDRAESLSQTVPGYYPGQTVADLPEQTNQAIRTGTQYATGAGQGVANTAQQQQQFIANNALSPDNNPALQAWMDAAGRGITRNYTNNVVPRIRQNAMMEGGVSGSAQGIAEGIAAGDYLQAIGDVNANIANAGYATGMDAYMKNLALAPQTYGVGMMPTETLGRIGDFRRDYNQQLLDADQERYWYEQNAPWEAIRNYQGAVLGDFGGTTTSPGNQTSLGQQVIGGGLAGFGISGSPWGAAAGAIAPILF